LATLLAIGYPEEGTAAQAALEAQGRRAELKIEPDAIAVVVRDPAGDYRVSTSHHPSRGETSWGMLWGLLFGLLFFVPVFGMPVGPGLGDLLGRIEGCGVNRAFQQQARDLVAYGSSALFLMVCEGAPERVLAVLDGFGGTLAALSLTPEQEASLQQTLFGDLSATASRSMPLGARPS
jgi:uncharacterized membrane protein